MKSYIDTINRTDILEIVRNSKSLGECVIKMGMSNQNANRQRLSKRLVTENIQTDFDRKYNRNLIGYKFGTLEVIKKTEKGGKTKWVCRCECGSEKDFFECKIISNTIKSCGCKQFKRGSDNHHWNGHGVIPGKYLFNIKNGSKKRGYEFSVTNEYILDLYYNQNCKCALSGVDIAFDGDEITASLDRIDNDKGYIAGNIQWIHKDINRMKNIFDNSYFIDICKKIAETYNGR